MADKQNGFSAHRISGSRLAKGNRSRPGGPSDPKNSNVDPTVSLHGLMIRDPEVPPPVDFENFLEEHHEKIARDDHRELLTFPEDDISVCSIQRHQRTLECRIPNAARVSDVPHIQRCIEYLTDDWSICKRLNVISAGTRLHKLRQQQCDKDKNNEYPRQEYEVDFQQDSKPDDVAPQRAKSGSLKPNPAQTGTETMRSPDSKSRIITVTSDAPVSFVHDLEGEDEDDVLADVLDDTIEDDELDRINKQRRNDSRTSSIMELYPYLEFEDARIEDLGKAAAPAEQIGYRIMVKCLDLSLELEVEPIYAVMALYDVREKKKISENFHFDLNSTAIGKMVENYTKEQCIPSLSRSAIFSISYPHPDIFLVVKLEKVYQQKDISECAEPYMKETDTAKNREKVKASAQLACERLGKFRMPFAWTAINIQDLVSTGVKPSYDRRDTGKSEDLRAAQRLALQQLTKENDNGLCFAPGRTGTIPEQPDQLRMALTEFQPITLTVTSFFRQEGDKLENEYMFKLLAELKKQGSLIRRLKCIPGTLKLDISVPSAKPPCCLTSDLYQVEPYPDPHCRPTREVAEHPPAPVLYPNSVYKNIFYVSPMHLNFTNRGGSARNIAIKVTLLGAEDEAVAPLKAIYGKSSSAKFLTEAWTPITYHSRTPDFYEEVKIELPVEMTEQHHVFFTIYHIKTKEKDAGAEPVVIGYSWLPLMRRRTIRDGDFFIPVLIDKPQAGYSQLMPDTYAMDELGAGLKWVDNKKPIFKVSLKAISCLYVPHMALANFLMTDTQDSENYNPGEMCGSRSSAGIHTIDSKGAKVSQVSLEPGANTFDFSNLTPGEILLQKLEGITKSCPPEILIRHLPVTINHYISYLARNDTGPITQAAMVGLVRLVHHVHHLMHDAIDVHGRCGTLNTYVTYVFNALSFSSPFANISADESLMTLTEENSGLTAYSSIHEAIVDCWLNLENKAMEEAMTHAWFFFQLIAKSMSQWLHDRGLLSAKRLDRFEQPFVEQVARLIIVVSEEVVTRHIKNPKFAQHLNASLAFFLQNILSLMDRGAVFSMVRAYLRQVTMAAAADVTLAQLKLDLVRVLCSHEHYIQLNLLLSPRTWIQILSGDDNDRASNDTCVGEVTRTSRRSSTVVIANQTSDSKMERSLVTLINRINKPEKSESEDDTKLLEDSDDFQTEDNIYSDLSTEYRQTHFISGLLLNEISLILEGNIPKLQKQAIATLRDVMVWHDIDHSTLNRSRIALLYVPLLGIVMDNFTRLWRDFSAAVAGNSTRDDGDSNEYDLGEDGEMVANYFQNSSDACTLTSKKTNASSTAAGNQPFNQEVTRDLLICFLWIIKNLSDDQFLRWWSCLELVRRTMFLAVLDVSVAAFEYKGRRTSAVVQGASDVKSRLANAILSGTGTAREKLIERRRQQQQLQNRGAPNPERRWGTTYHQLHAEGNVRSNYDNELDNALEAQLGCESTLTILDALELIISDASLDEEDMLNTMLSYAMRVMIHLFSTNQSVVSLANIFSSQRALVSKFPEFLVEVDTEQCSELCTVLIRLCNSSIARIRSEASASLYLIMRANYDLSQGFARVKAQSTVGLSNLAAQGMNCNADNVRKALRTILAYADADDEVMNSTFQDQVHELIGNMHMILRDTINLTECNKDPVMLLDLMYRIAKGYQNSPDLRLSWLQNMSQKHVELDNQAEAAMCMVHAAALVAEYLSMLGEDRFCFSGCALFENVTPNSLEESAVSDDVLAPDDHGTCSSKFFSVGGLVCLLGRASVLFELAGMWEYSGMLDHFTLPIFEMMGDHKLQHKAYQRMTDLQQKIIEQNQKGRRIVSSYFLVKFFGDVFEDLDGQEFIYRERPHYKLSELTQRFENFYGREFGLSNLVVLKDSKVPDRSKLDPDKGYLQLAYVTPYFDQYEIKFRRNFFQKNNNLCRFYYDVPFTETGKAHGDIDSQWKRRSIITTANSFPYVKTRCEVVGTEEILLSPAEVALEDMVDKYESLIEAARRDPPDPKGLQLQLQGVVGSRVNSGPAKVAMVFFKVHSDAEGKKIGMDIRSEQLDPVLRKLKRCFKDLLSGAQEALEKNRELITENQREYQKELERNFTDFRKELEPILGKGNDGVSHKKSIHRFGRQKTCRRQ